MTKNKKKNTNTKSADKNSQGESFEKEEQLSEEKSSENEVESKISSEMITALEEKVLRAHAEVENVYAVKRVAMGSRRVVTHRRPTEGKSKKQTSA